jgi:hypothetical protein
MARSAKTTLQGPINIPFKRESIDLPVLQAVAQLTDRTSLVVTRKSESSNGTSPELNILFRVLLTIQTLEMFYR